MGTIDNKAHSFDKGVFQKELLNWFHHQKRPLPWRLTYNPYHVWLSEVMLQQTQMDRGVGYFQKWIERFPTITDIAAASEEEILKMWEGLGYYARARNLHKAAKEIADTYHGQIPCDHQALLALPGIGPYTAAAIASIACSIDIPVIDANVARIYSRVFDIDGHLKDKAVNNQIQELAEQLLPKGKGRYWNQSLMDLGGLVCLPRSPQCGICPVQQLCLAYSRGTVAMRPQKAPKPDPVRIYRNSFVVLYKNTVLVNQVVDGKLWKGLYELPYTDGPLGEGVCTLKLADCLGIQPSLLKNIHLEQLTTVKHSYTKYRVEVDCFILRLDKLQYEAVTCGQFCSWQEIKRRGFSAGPRKIWEYLAQNRKDLMDELGALHMV